MILFCLSKRFFYLVNFALLNTFLFFINVANGQTLTITNGVTGLANVYRGGQTNQPVLGFTINSSTTTSGNTNLKTVVISHNALTAANLNGSFVTGNYRIGTCTSAAFGTFTQIASTVTENANDLTFSFTTSMVLTSGVTYFFFISANVVADASFTAGFPQLTSFSLNNTVTTTFKNNLGTDFATNAYGRIRNTVLPNLARCGGTGTFWWDIPNTTQTSDLTKLTGNVARYGGGNINTSVMNDGVLNGTFNTTNFYVDGSRDVTVANYYQAAGIVWSSAKTNIAQVKFYNATSPILTSTGGIPDSTTNASINGYFHDDFKLQYTTDGTTWLAAPSGWASSPVYPTNLTSVNFTVFGKTFTLTGPTIPSARGIRIMGKLRTGGNYSYSLGVREIEVFPQCVYYFKPAQTVVTSMANWGINEDGSGFIPATFIQPTQFYFRSNETLDANITSNTNTTFLIGAGLDPGVTLTMGTNTISNATIDIPLAITSGSNTLELAGATAPIIGLLSQGALGSTVTYNGGTQTVGNYNYNNLTINNNGTKTLGGNTTVNRTLNIQTGTAKLALASNTLTLNGTFTGNATNSLSLNGVSNLNIGGTGALGTLFFDQTTPGKSFGTSNTDFVALSPGTTNRLNNLTINRTSSGTITLGNELQITNLLTPTAGTLACGTPANGANLVMLSTDATTSSIGDLTNATITGNVNVQSFFKGGSVAANRGYRMIASPTSNTSTFFAQLRERFLITCAGGTADGCDIAPTKQPTAQTLTSYNEPGLTAGAASFNNVNHASTMEIGRGYYFFFRGNRSNPSALTASKINEPFVAPEDWTATNIGTVNRGDITVAVTKTTTTANTTMDGLNLIGNPYPAVLNFTSFQNDASNSGIIDNFLMIMKRDRTGFLTYSAGVLSSGSVSSVQSAGGTTATYPFIQPGQAFFVRKTAVGTPLNITFKEAHKAAAADSQKGLRTLEVKEKNIGINDFKSNVNSNNHPSVRQLIRFNIQSNYSQDDAAIVLEDGNSENYGGNDAPYMANNSINTYSLSADSVATSINFMPAVSEVKEIKLFVESTKSDDKLKLNFTELIGAGKNEVWLKDNFTQTNTLITKANNSYNFGIDKKNKATSGKDRFMLFFVPKIIYEINLNNFTATTNNVGVKLNWETKTETNSSKFELQRSVDGLTFETIHTLATKAVGGNSSNILTYNYLDKTALTGTVYYRLKMVVKNETSTYSEIKTVEFSFNDRNTVIIYPSPVKDELNITWKAKNKENFSLAIYDVSGKMVLNFNNIKSQNFNCNVTSLNTGVHFLKLKGQTTNSQIAVSKFVKN
ncbi:MAG: T9SS C-terminal target domain-containing protein [Sphingobacteriales bacterium]|nr:MAG: T9SS C-terminal target domain-containing protein [Sphingobacteriales bacterium]